MRTVPVVELPLDVDPGGTPVDTSLDLGNVDEPWVGDPIFRL